MNNRLQNIIESIDGIDKENVIIAIDGRCASGKTTLALELNKIYDCNVIHMDDFFLRPEQRTRERLKKPGENVDHERFLEEVLIPLSQGKEFSYRAYICSTGDMSDPIKIYPKKINIIEGSYSCHKSLEKYYDLKIFMFVEKEEQIRRLLKREGEESLKTFIEKWIPLEEKYFKSIMPLEGIIIR